MRRGGDGRMDDPDDKLAMETSSPGRFNFTLRLLSPAMGFVVMTRGGRAEEEEGFGRPLKICRRIIHDEVEVAAEGGFRRRLYLILERRRRVRLEVFFPFWRCHQTGDIERTVGR